MNWINHTATFPAVLRSALLLCSLLFFVDIGRAEPNVLEDGVLTINENFNLNSAELDVLTEDGPLKSIVINKESTLVIEPGTMVYLKDGTITVSGTLEISRILGTGIYSSEEPWDENIEDLQPDKYTTLTVNGNGVIRIVAEDTSPGFLMADTVDVILKKTSNSEEDPYIGGTIFVDANTTLQGGRVTGDGSAIKTGDGTLRVESINIFGDFTVEKGGVEFLNYAGIGGDFTIEEGTVTFGDTTKIGGNFTIEEGTVTFTGDTVNTVAGSLISLAGTTISGKPTVHFPGEENEESTSPSLSITGTVDIAGTLENLDTLTIVKGGKITGTLTDIGDLVAGNGTSKATLEFEGGNHTIERVGIARNTTVDIKKGTTIQLTSNDARDRYDDLCIEGTLRVSSASGTGIYKGDLGSLDLDPVYITVGGSTNEDGKVVGGIVEIYKSDPNPSVPEILLADTLHTQVIGIGQITVESGVTFESGQVKWGKVPSQTNVTGAHLIVSGGGTYRADTVDLGTGSFVINGDGTTMEFLKDVTAGALISYEGTQITTGDDATFESISLAGDYKGNNHNLTIQQGGLIAGQISDVNVFSLGGTTLLRVDNTDTPTISTNQWITLDSETARIRTVAGTATGSYQKVIQVMNNDTNKDQLHAILNASQTALYRPQWSLNEADNTFFDLYLSILSLDDYIRNEWRKGGKNIGNIGGMIEDISLQYPSFREYLEGLTEPELQNILRNALAGELAGNAFRIAMHQPAQPVFRHLDTVAPLRSSFGTRGSRTRGQVREGYHVWFNPYGQAERAKGETNTFDGYKMSTYGFYVGSDVEIYNRAVFGAFFGYAAPNVKSDLGKISANDYTGGLYFRIPTVWEMVINMMIGFGSQDYTYKNSYRKSDFRGSSLFGSVELSREFPFLPQVNYLTIEHARRAPRFTSLIALDFQSATMDGFTAYDPVLGGVLIEPEDLSSATLRVGLLSEFLRIRTRLQYMRQIAGDDVVLSQTTIGGLATTQIRGTQWGKDWLNVGIGGELLRTRHWRIFADYNFDMGKRTTSHLGSLNTVLQW